MKKKINNIIYIVFITIFLVVYILSIYLKKKFKNITTEQILYSLIYPKGTSINSMKDGIIYVSLRTAIILLIVYLISALIKKFNYKPYIIYKLNKNTKKIVLFEMTKIKKTVIMIILIIISLSSMIKALKIDEYIQFQKNTSSIFENYYVNPNKVKVEFPEQKQNLIYIYVESLETTNVSTKNGGLFDESIMPNLENIAKNNTNFSNTNKLGGAYNISGATWTAASLIAQTSGIPLKLQIDTSGYSSSKESIPGAYSIGEILEKNGYNNYLMIGSDANFGGRGDYFIKHGNYKIMDYYYAKEKGWIPEIYHVWWGYEDKKLYEFSKKEISNIAKQDKPFNFTILTADTHFENGYTDTSCPEKYNNPYANSIYCADIMLNDFIEWVKKQDFYQNTTIIITGDHLTMQSDFYDEILPDNYKRTVFNTIINSRQEAKNNKNREFTLMDMYPTTLSALGVTIRGDRLGLGTNLYSKEKTLIEKIGYNQLDSEISKKSVYYDNELLKK